MNFKHDNLDGCEFKKGDGFLLDGKIPFFMDFSLYEGEFDSDRVFTLTGFISGMADLKAVGFGDEKDYGNGSILIKPKYLNGQQQVNRNK